MKLYFLQSILSTTIEILMHDFARHEPLNNTHAAAPLGIPTIKCKKNGVRVDLLAN
jgi:hypothetical protein